MEGSRVTAWRFHRAEGVEDWRVLYFGAYAHYRCESFTQAAHFVGAIASVAEATGHFPGVDVRPQGVTVRTFTRADGALSERDIDLARHISIVATDMALEADPSQVQAVGIAVAQDAGVDVVRSGRQLSATTTSAPKTPSTPIDAIGTCGSTNSSHPDRGGGGSTSTSAFQPTRPTPGRRRSRRRRASRRRLPCAPLVDSVVTRQPWCRHRRMA